MTYRFETVYYDGVRSSPHPGWVEILPDCLIISFQDATGLQEIRISAQELAKSEFQSHGKEEFSTLRFGSAGLSSIEVRTPGFRDSLQTIATPSNIKGLKERRVKPGFIALLGAGLLSFLLLSWFVFVPGIGDMVGNNMPPEWEKALSTALEDSLLKEYPVDDELTGLLNEYAAAVNLPDLENTRIYVCESSQVNAFAIMGDAIFVFKPMLSTLDSSEELAALLFHEQAHLQLNHTTRTTMRSLASYYLISVFMGDSSGMMAVILQNLDILQRLQYSREFESEADTLAVQKLSERKMNTQGLAQLLRKIKKSQEDLPEVVEFLSTHPAIDNRIWAARALGVKYARTPVSSAVDPGDHQKAWEALKNQ